MEFSGGAIRKAILSPQLSKLGLEGRESKHLTAVSGGHLRESCPLNLERCLWRGQAALQSTVRGGTASSMVLT